MIYFCSRDKVFDFQGMGRILDVARMIGGVQIECGMREAVEEFVETLKFGLAEVVYEWAKGTSFKDITSLTSVQEGNTVVHYYFLPVLLSLVTSQLA